MTQKLDFSQYRADIIWLGNRLLEKYPWIPVLDPQSDDLVAQYDRAIAALLDIVPLDPGTVENRRSDFRREIDEYDDGESISAKQFRLRQSSFDAWKWLGEHYHQDTGEFDWESQFVEWFRMMSASWVLFVSQYTQNAVGLLIPWITVPYEIEKWNVLVFQKNQAHTFYLSEWEFQGVLATAFSEKDLKPAKLQFS